MLAGGAGFAAEGLMRCFLLLVPVLAGCVTPGAAGPEGVHLVVRSVSDEWLRRPLLAVGDEDIMVESEGVPRCLGRDRILTVKLRLTRETARRSVRAEFGAWSMIGALERLARENPPEPELAQSYFAPVDLARLGTLKRLARYPAGAPYPCPDLPSQQFTQP